MKIKQWFALILSIATFVVSGCSESDSPPGAASPASAAGVAAADVHYLHLYSTLYDVNVPARDYGKSENRTRKENQCLATIAVSPGVAIYADLPYHYEPSIRINGLLTRIGDSCEGSFTIGLEGVDVAYLHEQESAFPREVLVPVGEEPFHFAISQNPDPYSLAYERRAGGTASDAVRDHP